MTVLRQDCLPTPRLELDKDQACARSPFRLFLPQKKYLGSLLGPFWAILGHRKRKGEEAKTYFS